jgi:hypothetical protein
MTRKVIVVAVIAVSSVSLLGAQAPAADPIDGIWKQNLAKSTYSPGPPPPAAAVQSQVRKFSTLDGGWKLFELSGVSPQGDPVYQAVAFKIDGKPYPVYSNATLIALMTSGKPTTQTRSYRRIDANSTEFTTYNNGVAGTPTIRTVAKDGKSYTETIKGKNPQGQEVNNLIVWERVR